MITENNKLHHSVNEMRQNFIRRTKISHIPTIEKEKVKINWQ
jgi:hypothetical protein